MHENFFHEVKVYYEDTDAGGVVYHANYLKFAERSRTEMLRKMKIEQNILKEKYNIQFIVQKLFIEFFIPAKLDDLLKIKSEISNIYPAKINMQQNIYHKIQLLAKINLTLGSVNTEGKPTRLPKFVLNKLNTNINP